MGIFCPHSFIHPSTLFPRSVSSMTWRSVIPSVLLFEVIHPSIHRYVVLLFVLLSFRHSFIPSVHLSFRPSVYLLIRLCIRPSPCPSVRSSVNYLPIHPSIPPIWSPAHYLVRPSALLSIRVPVLSPFAHIFYSFLRTHPRLSPFVFTGTFSAFIALVFYVR